MNEEIKMICTNCSCCESICSCGDDQELEESSYCENCGTIASLEDLNEDGYCNEDACVEAHEEWKDNMSASIVDAFN